MEVVLPSIFPQWAQDLNTGLSFLGFLISAYTLYEVTRIKANFLARARLPDIIKDLTKTGSLLNTALRNWASHRNEARSHIKVSATLLNAAMPMLPGAERKEIKKVKRRLDTIAAQFSNPNFPSVEEGWDIYSDIQSCLTSLTQVSKNTKWE